jgi:hypothetical protein
MGSSSRGTSPPPKIAFNSKISNQQRSSLLFLIRKVVTRKGYPICCLFYNETQQKFIIYLSDYKKGALK